MKTFQTSRLSAVLATLVFLSGCGDDDSDASRGQGNLTVQLGAEETITDGLDPGDGPENVVDGWTVRFDKYVVAIGDVTLRSDAENLDERSSTRLAFDLTSVPQSGVPLTEFFDIEATEYNFFGYALVPAGDAERDPTVSESDFEAMKDANASYLIEGFIEKSDGESCPPGGECRAATRVDFRFLVPAHVVFGPCQMEDVPTPGVTVTSSGTSSAGITIHGDHMLFDAFPTGDEIVSRRAQWIADADVDGSGTVDYAELEAIQGADLSALFPVAEYSLGTWTNTNSPIESAADFLRNQVSTQGHYNGEGECLWTLVP
jgi:hypothetical protein